MIGKKVTADGKSIAIGGDNNGEIINVCVEPGGVFNFNNGIGAERSLGSYLGKVISVVAQQTLSEYGHAYQSNVTNEVQDKLIFNHITLEDRIIQSFRKYYFLLDRAYKGVEQSNNDARVLVRHRAGSIYSAELSKACTAAAIPGHNRVQFSRNNAHALIEAVKHQLVQDYKSSEAELVDPAWIDLAVSLLVIDAVAECDVLERAPNATPA